MTGEWNLRFSSASLSELFESFFARFTKMHQSKSKFQDSSTDLETYIEVQVFP